MDAPEALVTGLSTAGLYPEVFSNGIATIGLRGLRRAACNAAEPGLCR
jgi:hypothetical protein